MRLPWPFGHVGLKSVSIGIAIALWMAVAGEDTVERGLRVPLELQQFPPDLELIDEPPTLVDVRVRGTSGALALTVPSDIIAVIDLRHARAGRRLFQLTPEQVRAPFGIEVVQITPATIALEFEASATRKVPVAPSVEGNPAPGFVMGSVTVAPSEVEIAGPASAVETAREVLTEPIAVEGATASVTATVNVGVLNPLVRVRAPRSVSVTVPIAPGPSERTFRASPVHLRGLGPSLMGQALPPSVAVFLRGSRAGVSRTDASDVVAWVDLRGLGPGAYTLPVQVETPAAVGVVRIDPATVHISIANDKSR
ncbi:MAG: hypothetical protein FJW27_17940 [Acidimicrobiia bacterium]|nr:hypothetical protein [Acidimicrobiia bacterium]